MMIYLLDSEHEGGVSQGPKLWKGKGRMTDEDVPDLPPFHDQDDISGHSEDGVGLNHMEDGSGSNDGGSSDGSARYTNSFSSDSGSDNQESGDEISLDHYYDEEEEDYADSPIAQVGDTGFARRGSGGTLIETINGSQDDTVFLLQSILPGSRFEGLKRWVNFPIHGHWAVIIHKRVYELNRIESYFFTLLRGEGAEATLLSGGCPEMYVAERGASTIEWQRLGTVKWGQARIDEAIKRRIRSKPRLAYSLFTNNCQHFIMDLCEHINVKFEGESYKRLWFKSRWIFLIGSCIYLSISIAFLAVHFQFEHASETVDGKYWRLFLFLAPTLLTMIVGEVVVSLIRTTPPRTISKKHYMHGTCYTGSYMKKCLCRSGGANRQIRALLVLETVSYFYFLCIGLVIAFLLDIFRVARVIFTAENLDDLNYHLSRVVIVLFYVFRILWESMNCRKNTRMMISSIRRQTLSIIPPSPHFPELSSSARPSML